MRILLILLTLALLQAHTRVGAQTITLTARNMPLSAVFAEVKKQTGFRVVSSQRLLAKAKPVSVSVTNQLLANFLGIVLKEQSLDYKIENKTIFIKERSSSIAVDFKSTATYSDTTLKLNIRGRIINEKGDPVIATITVKGINNAISSNANGDFFLKIVDENAVLVISGISIQTIEIKPNGKNTLLIKATTKISSQEEVTVVNTGYQKISKERFVGSFSQLDSTNYTRRAGMDILSRLDGTVTGILFDKKSPSGGLSNIQIRGISTLNSSKGPLIIVDNFPFRQDLSVLNPNDVLTVTLLRDAAATSIWGAQAGNGVIVITTKRGKFNQPSNVSASSNITVQDKPDFYYYPQISSSDFIDLEIFLFNRGKYDGSLNNNLQRPVISPVVEVLTKKRDGKLSAFDSANQIDGFRTMDLRQDLDQYVYRQAISQQHYISISGGNNVFNFNFSGGYNHSLNNVQHSKPDDQFTLNSTTGFRPFKKLEITTGINYSQGQGRSSGFLLPSQISPYTQLADAQGKVLAIPYRYRTAYLDTVGAGQLLDWQYRPLEELRLNDATTITRFIQLNIGITYQLTTWLKASVNYQNSNESSDNTNYQSIQTYYTRDLINQFTNLSQTSPDLRNPIPIGGILNLFHLGSKSQNARGQLDVTKNFGSRHLISAGLAADVSETIGDANTNGFYGYNKETGSYKSTIDYLTSFPSYANLNGSQQISNNSNSLSNNQTNKRLVSFLGRASYTYNDRYTIYASAKKDGGNAFGVNANRKWKPLWSIGSSWDVSKESFYRIHWMSSLRLRASYGYSGNPGPPDVTGFPIIQYTVSGPAYLTNSIYAFPQGAPNPDLKWEKVGIVNAGLDMVLFNGRISGNLDIWRKKSTDLISLVPYAPATGISFFITNTANLRGNGFEMALQTKNIDRAFKWQSNIGLSYAKTIVTKLLAVNPRVSAQDFISYSLNAAEGKVVYGIASYRWAGLDPLNGDPRGYLNKQVSVDYDAIINDSVGNQIFHGSSIPLYSGFIGNSFSWKNFTLSTSITYRFDFYFRKPTISYGDLVAGGQGHADYAARWQKTGDEKYTNVPSFVYPVNDNRDLFFQYAEINVLRGDNVRLQDVRLQYNYNNSSNKKTPIKALQLFVYANNLNLILWRKNKSNLDPDFVGGDNFTPPTSKTWTGGVNLTF